MPIVKHPLQSEPNYSASEQPTAMRSASFSEFIFCSHGGYPTDIDARIASLPCAPRIESAETEAAVAGGEQAQ
jgi:hypothetical protein